MQIKEDTLYIDSLEVDNELNSTSTNPVQNSVVTAALASKLNTSQVLSNISIVSPGDNQVLSYSNGEWVNRTITLIDEDDTEFGGALDDLSDVSIGNNVSDDHLLTYNNGRWVNQAYNPSEAITITISDSITENGTNLVTGAAIYDQLDGKEDIQHAHAISDIEDLSDELANKATTGHTHSFEDITDVPEPDDALDLESTNAVQNGVITAALNTKVSSDDYATTNALGIVQPVSGFFVSSSGVISVSNSLSSGLRFNFVGHSEDGAGEFSIAQLNPLMDEWIQLNEDCNDCLELGDSSCQACQELYAFEASEGIGSSIAVFSRALTIPTHAVVQYYEIDRAVDEVRSPYFGWGGVNLQLGYYNSLMQYVTAMPGRGALIPIDYDEGSSWESDCYNLEHSFDTYDIEEDCSSYGDAGSVYRVVIGGLGDQDSYDTGVGPYVYTRATAINTSGIIDINSSTQVKANYVPLVAKLSSEYRSSWGVGSFDELGSVVIGGGVANLLDRDSAPFIENSVVISPSNSTYWPYWGSSQRGMGSVAGAVCINGSVSCTALFVPRDDELGNEIGYESTRFTRLIGLPEEITYDKVLPITGQEGVFINSKVTSLCASAISIGGDATILPVCRNIQCDYIPVHHDTVLHGGNIRGYYNIAIDGGQIRGNYSTVLGARDYNEDYPYYISDSSVYYDPDYRYMGLSEPGSIGASNYSCLINAFAVRRKDEYYLHSDVARIPNGWFVSGIEGLACISGRLPMVNTNCTYFIIADEQLFDTDHYTVTQSGVWERGEAEQSYAYLYETSEYYPESNYDYWYYRHAEEYTGSLHYFVGKLQEINDDRMEFVSEMEYSSAGSSSLFDQLCVVRNDGEWFVVYKDWETNADHRDIRYVYGPVYFNYSTWSYTRDIVDTVYRPKEFRFRAVTIEGLPTFFEGATFEGDCDCGSSSSSSSSSES